MTRIRDLTIIYLASGAVWVGYVLLFATWQGSPSWLRVGFALFGAGLAVAAGLWWRRHPAAWDVSLAVQLPQIPYFLSQEFGWSLYSPLSVAVGCHDSFWTFMMQFEGGAGLTVGSVKGADGWRAGVNLAPLLVLWLIDRASTVEAGREDRAARLRRP